MATGLAKGSSGWFVLGGGNLTGKAPTGEDIDYKTNLGVAGGGDVLLFGPVFFSFGFSANMTSATADYSYENKEAAKYTAKNVDVAQTSTGLEAGLHFRLINKEVVHFFIEGGGYLETWKLEYSFTEARDKTGLEANRQNSQSEIHVAGVYTKAGFDLMVYNGYGMRVFGRARKGITEKIEALTGRTMAFTGAEGYVGLVKQF